ncbi:MAG: cbb3-type cytochrome c oxidase N-terminal domain-containing protein [Cyclobacteriaceae bacterium]
MNLPKSIFSFFLLALMPALASAQEKSTSEIYSQYQVEIVLGMAGVVLLVALIALFAALYALMAIVNLKKQAAGEVVEEKESFWVSLWKRMNDAVPIEEEETVMTDHAYDGIKELDNRLPPWWLYSFYATIIFGVIYILNYHVFKTAPLQEEEYIAEMKQAEAEVETYLASLDNLIDENSVTFVEDDAELLGGKEIFISKCAACHGQQGEGGVGPNLTDQYWIHGGDVKSIFKTIKYGVPSKGMISWQSQLSPKEMQQVSSFIYTMEGSNPPNGKEPQGELFEREETTSETEESKTVEAGV